MESTDSRATAQFSEFPEVDQRAWNQPSTLPEVVQPSYPEAHGYIRPRNEPGEKAAKILAYDLVGKEVKHDTASPLTSDGAHLIYQQTVQSMPKEPPSEKIVSETSKHLFRGCTPWRLLVLAVIVILAAVGGGVGGGIAASIQHSTSTAKYVAKFPSSAAPALTSSSPSTLATVLSTTSSSPAVSQTPTNLKNQTREFSFQAYERPNYEGGATNIYRTIGSQTLDFNCTSYIWQPNETTCCVTFCANHKWGGWWCQPRQQLVGIQPLTLAQTLTSSTECFWSLQ
ncbi:hypothetical protein BKA67DRAFT_539283 [Truncatella angustata]|uniref:Uncharacterized protein n=1 Tax=Truncatella angustata TaxID=152316 RepID=A0A9P8RKC4_9PEZI|nr:uncharacterized protein BKA67DRAFT_539283 [Truncatella angustata]KAH6647416.1 hypothetical protein BKA67DRAFT_539283 [Truncatella angustata]